MGPLVTDLLATLQELEHLGVGFVSLTKPSTEYHKIWVEQCTATEDIRERFGLESALDYLIGEKLFSFVAASEQDSLFAQELADFVAEIRRLFTPAEIRAYLGHLERTKFLAPPRARFRQG